MSSLYQKIIRPESLLSAFRRASKEKRLRPSVMLFEKDLSINIFRLHFKLKQKTWHHGKYRFFIVHDQKERRISAAPFPDRIVHHALCKVIEPIFEKSFIEDSYANRTGKGIHKAVTLLQKFLKQCNRERGLRQKFYCLKCDISKCFPSINHEILLKIIAEKIKDAETLWLIEKIVSSFETGNEYDHLFPKGSPFLKKLPKGIPIGNLTSQLFVNVYLDPLDNFVKNVLNENRYIRYVDDFVILHHDKKHLHRIKNKITDFLGKKLCMEMHPTKQRVFPVSMGIDFLGYVVFEDFKLLRKSNKESFRKKLRKMKKLVRTGRMSEEKAVAAITSWLAHVSHADSYRLRKRFFGKPLRAKNQKEIKKIVSLWKSEWPIHKSSGQLRLF